MRVPATAWLLAGLCLAPALARAAPGFTTTCPDALREHQVDDLVTRLRTVDDGCRLERIDTAAANTVIEWSHAGRTHTALIAPRGCLREPNLRGSDIDAHIPDSLTACPGAHAALAAFLAAAHRLAPVVAGDGQHSEETTLADPRRVATVAWLAALLLALSLALRRLRSPRSPDDRSWSALAAALFVLGLIARFAVEPAPANWYGAFLPLDGWGDLRFGSAAAVLQAAVRAVLPWTADAAFTLVRITGSLAVPLIIFLVRRLGGSLLAAAFAGVIVALAPIPVRLSASSSEHVLAATLALAAWVTWLRTAEDPTRLPRLLAVTLAALAALTRIDSLPQLALIPLWTTLFIRPSHTSALPRRRRRLDAAFFYGALAVVALHGYLDIVVPSHHPGPELHGVLQASKRLLSQLWIAASTPPHWLTFPTLALVLLGLAAAVARREWRLLLTCLASLALVFIPLGRNLVHDGLTGARYFILLTPLLALSVVPLLAWLTARWPARRLALLLPPFVALELWSARPGWRHETTFQAEHRLLGTALADPHYEDCTLWFVRPRQPTGEPDLDCCLDPEQSPLPLQYPHIRFAPVATDRPLDDATGCHLYYRGAICSLDPALAPAAPRAAARILAACARLPAAHELLRAEVPLDTITPRSRTPPVITLSIRGDNHP